MKTFCMKFKHFCILLMLVFGVDLFGQQSIVWENRDELICEIISYDKDSVVFKLINDDELQTVSTKDIKYVYTYGRNNKRKKVEYLNEKDKKIYSYKNKNNSYVFPDKNTFKKGIQNQLSTNFGFQIEQEGGMNINPHLKYSVWSLGRKKLGFGGSLSYINYSPSEKKMFLTPSIGVYYVPKKKATTNFMAEIGYGYSSSSMVNFLDKDFRTNVLVSKGGLYSGVWMEKQLFGLDKSVINLTAGFTYQRGTFEVEVFEDIFIYKNQTIDFLRFWVGTGVRF